MNGPICYTVEDAVDWWFDATFRKRTTTALYSIVNQLDTARTVYLERAYKSKVFCGYSIKRFIPGGNSYDLYRN